MQSFGEGLEQGNVGVPGVTVGTPRNNGSVPIIVVPPLAGLDPYGTPVQKPAIDQPRVQGSVR